MSNSTLLMILQLVAGLGLLNVWLVRAGSTTAFRGGDAKSLRQEFREYGLPDGAYYLVGGIKVAAGLVFIAGLWLNLPIRVAAGAVALLMLGALAMHVKVGDPAVRSVPALIMLGMTIAIIGLA